MFSSENLKEFINNETISLVCDNLPTNYFFLVQAIEEENQWTLYTLGKYVTGKKVKGYSKLN